MSSTINTYKDRALVLEGGAMRGAFTAGALDCLLDNNIDFGYTIGVSAGSTNALNFAARQRGRTIYADTTLLQERKYIGLGVWLRKGIMIDMDLLFGEFSTDIYPFDFDAFSRNENRFEIVTTDCVTGEARYFEKCADRDSGKEWDWDRMSMIAQASSSLPFLNNRVVVDGREMLDGGLSDSVPLARAMSHGYGKALVILTQCAGYRKERKFKLPNFLYRKFPRIVELLNSRAERYNRDCEWIEELERKEAESGNNDIIIIRPTPPLEVGRLTTDATKIKALYEQGYEAAKSILHKLK
ncbi:MAG: patatin family protein [Rikenellaceae bacterium]